MGSRVRPVGGGVQKAKVSSARANDTKVRAKMARKDPPSARGAQPKKTKAKPSAQKAEALVPLMGPVAGAAGLAESVGVGISSVLGTAAKEGAGPWGAASSGETPGVPHEDKTNIESAGKGGEALLSWTNVSGVSAAKRMPPWKYKKPSQDEINQISSWAHRSRLQYHVKIGVIPQSQADFMMTIYSPDSVSYGKLFRKSEKWAKSKEEELRFARRMDKAMKNGSIDQKRADTLRALPADEADQELTIVEGLMGNWLSLDQARTLRQSWASDDYYWTARKMKREADKAAQIQEAVDERIVDKKLASTLRKLPVDRAAQLLEIARARHSGLIDEETAHLLSMMDLEHYWDAMGAIKSEKEKDELVDKALSQRLIDDETAHRLRMTTPPRVKLELEVLESGRKSILTLKETEGLLWALDVMGAVVAGEIHRDLVRAREN